MHTFKSIVSLRLLLLTLVSLVAIVFSVEAQTKAKAKAKPKPKRKVVYSSKTSSKYRSKTAYKKPVRTAPVSPIMVSNLNIVRSQSAFTFTNRWYDFGDVVQGEKVTHSFTFKNTGKEPLIISAVQPTCGCTVTEWTRTPIPPGQNGDIIVTFDSKSALNQQNKTITVVSNASTGNERLYLRGNVLPKR